MTDLKNRTRRWIASSPGTLTDHLKSSNHDLRTAVVSKRSMIQVSRMIERLALADGSEATVTACFQHERHWQGSRRRYEAMAAEVIVLRVPSDDARPEPRPCGPTLVALDDADPFVREWFVVATGPSVSVTLAGVDLEAAPGSGPLQASRTFEALVSTDPRIAEQAQSYVRDRCGHLMPARGREALDLRAQRPWVARRSSRVGRADHLLNAALEDFDEHALRQQELEEQAKVLRHQLTDAEARERRRIVETVHDDSLQYLVAAAQDLAEIDPPAGAREDLERAQRNLADGIQALREAIRGARSITPSGEDLEAQLEALCEQQAERGGFEVALHVDPLVIGLEDQQVVACVRELVTNAAKHSRAAEVVVRVMRGPEDRAIDIQVSDDGVGFSTATLERARRDGHIGLSLASDRIRRAGGTWTVKSSPGCGVQVEATLPLNG